MGWQVVEHVNEVRSKSVVMGLMYGHEACEGQKSGDDYAHKALYT